MAWLIIPAGDFFTDSPEIRIRRKPTVEDTVREVMIWTEQQAEKGGKMNCQVRPSSDEEKRGHLARLEGVKKMHAMLLELKGKTDHKLKYHKRETQWEALVDEHPCGMLAYSDKWWMMSWDEYHLARCGHPKREEPSRVPVKMRPDRWYHYSGNQCKYCNGTYDKMISSA